MTHGTRPRVAVFDPIDPAGLELLGREAEVMRLWELPDAEREQIARSANGWLVRTSPLPASLIDASSELRAIAKHGVGVDNIDVAAATRRGVVVTSTPGANSQAVAEHAVAMMLALAKRLPFGDRAVRQGDFASRYRYATTELAGKTLGLVGSGRIGSLVARMCHAGFGMRVLVYDPYLPDEALVELGAGRAPSVAALVREADVVSVHAPLTAETRHIVDASVLRAMKATALLVNCARGELVDTQALAEALAAGTIAGAGIDVFESEPPDPSDPLLRQEHGLFSPHQAGGSAESLARMATTAAEEVLAVLRGDPPRFAINS